jgi:predicted alpha/beta hydrolase family esterase
MKFNSRIFILPGLGNSGPGHWQTLWENRFPELVRIHQGDWDTPRCEDWIKTIHDTISSFDLKDIILVAHSLACSTIGYWSKKYNHKIRGALLVAPSDTEAETYPFGTTGFRPMPTTKLPFKSIVVASDNDFYVSTDRARSFSDAWGSELVVISHAGHINASSGLGEWPMGLDLLKKLDSQP